MLKHVSCATNDMKSKSESAHTTQRHVTETMHVANLRWRVAWICNSNYYCQTIHAHSARKVVAQFFFIMHSSYKRYHKEVNERSINVRSGHNTLAGMLASLSDGPPPVAVRVDPAGPVSAPGVRQGDPIRAPRPVEGRPGGGMSNEPK